MEREFEWDEDKRHVNIDKHGSDFRDAQQLFDGSPILGPDDSRTGRHWRAPLVGADLVLAGCIENARWSPHCQHTRPIDGASCENSVHKSDPG